MWFKILWGGPKVARQFFNQKENVTEAYEKHSIKSVEFWVAVITGLAAVAASATGLMDSATAAYVTTGTSAAYALSRGLAKFNQQFGGVKPSWASTETYVSLFATISASMTAASQGLEGQTAAIMAAIAAGALTISRGMAKGGKQPENVPPS